jgi:acyl-coenzyme A thioesterase PaaI-like protein
LTVETDPALELAALLHRALASAASVNGRSVAPVTLNLDYAELGEGRTAGPVSAEVDRATRSLVFVSGDARDAAGRVLASASGVFRVLDAG